MATDSLKEMFVEWAENNIGGAVFLRETVSDANITLGVPILAKLSNMDIRGYKLHILWKDLCDHNMVNVYRLVMTCPKHILEEACAREDRTGKTLVKQYLTTENFVQ